MGGLQRLAALDAKVLDAKVMRRHRRRRVRQLLRIAWLIGFVLAVPVGIPCALLANVWSPLLYGVGYPIGWTLFCLAKVGWHGIKADLPWPQERQRRPSTRS